MPPDILSSGTITLPVIETLLNSQQAQDPIYRAQLLTTKLTLLTNSPPNDGKNDFDIDLQVLRCRLELAFVSIRLRVPDLGVAEREAGMVERGCRGIGKRLKRELEQENEEGSAPTTIEDGSNTNTILRQRHETITSLRITALKLLGEVEELKGRPERRGRWDDLANSLETELS
jgi:hypothetical protein